MQMHCVHENGVCYYMKCTILLQMMNANFLYEVLTSNPKKIYLVQVQCKVKNAMHDDKQIFLDFLKIKEIQKEKE